MSKISKYIFFKFNYAFILCIFSLFTVFFIFTLLGNLGEQHNFNQIINLSLLSTIQIFFYIPMFIFFLIVLVFIIEFRSKNEFLIVSHYLNKKNIYSIILIYIIVFSFIEINKNLITENIEEFKIEKFYQNKSQKFKLFVDNSDKNTKEFFLFRKSKTNKINSVNIFKVENNFISEALFSDKVKFLGDKIILKNLFQLINNKITKNKIIEKNYPNFTNEIKKNKIVSHLNNKYFYKLTFSSFLSFIFNFFTLYICFMIMIGKYVNRKTNDIGINFLTCVLLIFYTSIFLKIDLFSFNKTFIYLGVAFLVIVFLKMRLND